MTSSQSSNAAPRWRPRLGNDVITPSDAIARVIAIYDDVDEALVEWENGDRARFKLGLLRKIGE